jgi:hypothetical protein
MKYSFMILLFTLLGCSPTVKLAPSGEPIVVNLNINIEHKIKIERELDKALENKSIF